ncbi:insulin-degrading enzyme [Medicago truncatula]|uniref:Insulin-degrading enzyme n=1 Tax=Medicago truncatula TaxID=3880 RepID=G7K4K4_MEDTR|nr:insulin-degrading enzyme [Medicago truncatula]
MEDTVIKSKHDIRDYRVIKLENGLEALVVHDPRITTKDDNKNEGRQVKMCCAAMTIGVGSLHAPKRVQGLPHLLEHMLVEGSQKFSEKKDYLSYISEHGGSTDEFTNTEHCNFSFQVNGKFLKGALRRFAHIFIEPLLSKEILEAEVNAVESEFNERKEEWKLVHDGLLCHTSREGHPYNNVFLCGNRGSLMGEKDDCDDLHKEVLKFHRKEYHAEKMKLVIISGETLDGLQGWIEKLFDSIKKCPAKKVESRKRKRILSKRPVWKSGEQYHIVLETLNTNILVVSWILLSLRNVYEHKPDRYISYFLNQEGTGSLISLLKDKGLAKSLTAEIGDGICHTANIFSIRIGLTNSGILEINKIIGLIYEYLTLLRDSPPEWMFKEIQSVGELAFNFGEENDQREYAVKLSENLLQYPPKHVIYADHLYEKWNEPLIKQVLGYFLPENMRIYVYTGGSEMEVSKLVPWFGIPYSVQDIEESLMKFWKETQEAHEPLGLPCKNEFIPYNTSIDVGDIVDEDFSNMTPPKCIFDEDSMKLWYKRDCTSKAPFACIYIQIKYSKGVWDNAKTCALSELFISFLRDKLNEVISKAQMAMLNTKLRFIDGMLEVKVFGHKEMLPSLLSKILSEVNSFMPTDDGRYELVKENAESSLMEDNDDNEFLETLLREHIYVKDELVNYLHNLSLDDVTEFIEEIRSQTFIEGLVHGNLSEDDANKIYKIVKQIFPNKSLPIVPRHVERVMCLTPKTNFVVNYSGMSSVISTAQLYIQIRPNLFNSIKKMALLDLFDVIVEKPFYDRIRREENLGYTVQSYSSEIHNVWGFCFDIASSDHEPYYLQHRIEEFVDGLEKVFEDLDSKTFKKYRRSLVDKKLQGCSSLEDESCQVWKEISKYSGNINITQKVAEQLKQITKDDLMRFYRKYFKKSSGNCRRLKINVWSSEKFPEADDSPYKDENEEVPDDEDNPNYW